jgi:hypothetical protein
MPAKKPSQKPENLPASGTAQARAELHPVQEPSISEGIGAIKMADSQPKDLTADQIAMSAATVAGDAKPTVLPPAQATSGMGGIATWQSGMKITALWSINQNRNAWIFVNGVGWKKLANNSDTAVVALNMLSASARLTQTAVNYRDEADGMIHEIYVW